MNEEYFNDRMPPQNIDAERSVLGAILINPKQSIPRAIGILHGYMDDCFCVPAHQSIFNGLIELYNNKKAIDAITIQDQLEKMGTLEESGGLPYIVELTGAVPTSANMEYYTDIVAENARKRKILGVLNSGISSIYELEADDITAILRQGLIGCEPNMRNGLNRIDKYIPRVMADLESYMDPDFERSDVKTGIRVLDNILLSLGREELIVLAARTSVGKSAVALNIAKNVAMGQGIPVLFFSLEMSIESCLERLMQMVGEVDIHKYRRGVANWELAGIGDAAKKVEGIDLWINDTDRIPLDEMLSVIRLHIEKEQKPGMIVIDYLQLISLGGAYSRIDIRQRITIVTGALKAMAKEFKCPVICLSQLNRNADDDPQLIHLAESGSIENDADKVILISKLSGDSVTDDHRVRLRFNVAKNRNGLVGRCEVLFVQAHQLIRDLNYQPPVEEEEGHEQQPLY